MAPWPNSALRNKIPLAEQTTSGNLRPRFIPAVEYIQANRARTLLIEQLNEKMKGVDIFVAPAFGSNLRVTNLSGHPCVVLPNGFRNDLPAAITFTGQLFGEGKLLQVAAIYQKATGFNEKHPSLSF